MSDKFRTIGRKNKFSANPAGNYWSDDVRYVRPSGDVYGPGNGLTYGSAWSGFANIEWDQIEPGSTLYICGNHKETLTVPKSGLVSNYINIRGDYSLEAGVIDAENIRNICLYIYDHKYINVEGITLTRAKISCLHVGGSAIISTKDIEVSYSGNQGVQHLQNCQAVHYDIYAHHCDDDGISGHDNAIIDVIGATIEDNDQGINIINSVVCTISGTLSFSGQITYDLYCAVGTGCTMTVNGGLYNQEIYCVTGSIMILNGITANGNVTVGATSTITINESKINGDLRAIDVGGQIDIDKSIILGDIYVTSGEINVSNSYVTHGEIALLIGTLTLIYCLLNGSGKSDHLLDNDTGNLYVRYCVFINIPAVKFGISHRSTANNAVIDNCTFIGTAGVGRGIYTQKNLTTNNNILLNLEVGYWNQLNTSNLNNYCFFDNTQDINAISTVNNNNPQNGDPLLNNISGFDFSLGIGSPCIANGLNLGVLYDDGIDTASWGDGINTLPKITTKQQAAAWDIGAFVS